MRDPLHSIPDALPHRATISPDRVALAAGGRTWTFRELDHDVSDVARRLVTLGASPDAFVATLLTNGAPAALVAHALPRTGATLVPLNVRSSSAEIALQLDDCGARVLLVDAATHDLASQAVATLAADVTLVVADDASIPMLASLRATAPSDATLVLAHDSDDTRAVMYTSGTTGRPKGARLTFGNFLWSAIGSALNLGTAPDDRWVACLPLFHVGGLSILTRAAIYGITAVVHQSFDASRVNAAIDDEGATIVSVVAVMLQRMLDARADAPFPPTLRCLLLGGGPAPRPLLERCARIGAPVVQTYGLTETTSQIATLAPDDALRKLGSAGKPLYPNELRVATSGDASGEGDILVRGPVVSPGYLRDDTPRDDGWFRTGDVGRLDDDGYLYVLERRTDLVVTGGENVYPSEVEAALLAHDAVEEAGVFGAADNVWGQRVVAVVRLRDGFVADAASLREHCRTRIASYKVPSDVRITVDPLPRTASGKLRRVALVDVR